MEASIISCRPGGSARVILVHVLRKTLHESAAPPGIIVLRRIDLQVTFQKRVYGGKRSGLISRVLIIPLALTLRVILACTPQEGVLIPQARRHSQYSAGPMVCSIQTSVGLTSSDVILGIRLEQRND